MRFLCPPFDTIDGMMDRSALNDIDAYCVLFMDTAFWTPAVQAVLHAHGLEPVAPVETGVPGTCPTFLVGKRWVVKFFGRLFEGGEAFRVEAEANRIAARDPLIPLARVAATGALGDEDWDWPYLVFDYIAGKSTGELSEVLTDENRMQIARDLGGITRRLHALSLDGSSVFDAEGSTWRAFLRAQRGVCAENHRAWGTLPPRLVDGIDDFLQTVELPESRPHLIHADLTRDHLLGRVLDGRWETLALIDFGDAMAGDLYYELAALYLDLFGADRKMLDVFLDSYQLSQEQRDALPRRALAGALLHRFNVLENLPEFALQASTLDALAQILWGKGSP